MLEFFYQVKGLHNVNLFVVLSYLLTLVLCPNRKEYNFYLFFYAFHSKGLESVACICFFLTSFVLRLYGCKEIQKGNPIFYLKNIIIFQTPHERIMGFFFVLLCTIREQESMSFFHVFLLVIESYTLLQSESTIHILN